MAARRRGAAAAVFACLVAHSVPAAGQGQPVAVELALAVDVSISISDIEFRLQMLGFAEAFRSEEVVRLVGGHEGGVAITLYQWDGSPYNHHSLPWRLLTDEASLKAFADQIEKVPRHPLGYYTGIGHAIDFGTSLIDSNEYAGRLMRIDVSGDGRSNAGPEPSEARARAVARGITVNGLAILDGDRTLAHYYRVNVAGGPNSFVITADDYEDFGRAIKVKLLRELAPESVSEGPSRAACAAPC